MDNIQAETETNYISYENGMPIEENNSNPMSENQAVHPSLLESSPPSSWFVWALVVCLNGYTIGDALSRFVSSFAFSIAFVPLGIDLIFTLREEKKRWSTQGERVFGRVIYKQENKMRRPPTCFFVVEYTTDGITYQKKFADDTLGLIATETYLELNVDMEDPKHPILACEVESYPGTLRSELHGNKILLAVVCLASPFVVLSFVCASKTLSLYHIDNGLLWFAPWLDAVTHYFFIAGIQFLYRRYTTKRKDAAFHAVVLDKVVKPFVPEPTDRVSYHALLCPPPESSRAWKYLHVGFGSLVVWVMYGSEMTRFGIWYFTLLIFTFPLTWSAASALVDRFCLKSLRHQFLQEGVPPKHMTVLKSGGQDGRTVSIIHYEIEFATNDGMAETVTVMARVNTVDERRILILPSVMTSIFAPTLPKSDINERLMVLGSPVAFVIFVYCEISRLENASSINTIIFGLITGTLCIIASVCFAMASAQRVIDSAMGKTGATIVLERRKWSRF